MNGKILILSFCLWFGLLNISAYAQVTFDIVDHKVNEAEKRIELFVNGMKDNVAFLPDDAGKYKVTETFTENPLSKKGKMNIVPHSFDYLGGKAFQLLFLVDKSGSMRGEKFAKAKQAILKAINNNKFPLHSVHVAYYHETVTPSVPLSIKNYQAAVGRVFVERAGKGKDTHLYYSLSKKLEEWKTRPGRKVIILLTDGKNDIYGDDGVLNTTFNSGGEAKVTQYNMLKTLRGLDSSVQLYCIGFGNDADSLALQKMVNATPSTEDEYLFSKTPDDLTDKLGRAAKKSNYNLKLSVKPDDFCAYKAKLRTISLTVHDNGKTHTAKRDYKVGDSALAYRDWCNKEIDLSLTELLMRWAGIILGTLFLFMIFIPIIADFLFEKKYVKKYYRVKKANQVVIDPITTLEIADNDLVVAGVCPHINLRQSWKDNKNKCGERKCKKSYSLHSSTGNILKQNTDLDRQMSWVWYGGLGGGIAWLIYKILATIDEDNFVGLFSWFSEKNFVNSYHDALNIGMALGFGILLTFGIAEEYGQTRAKNFGRVLLRAFIGMLIGGVLYVFLNFINQNVTTSLGFFGHLFSWVVFGLVLSMLTSLWSSIEPINAFKAGLIASVLAFLVYYFLTNNSFFEFNNQFGEMLGLIFYGAILGAVLNRVVSQLEDFHLDFISPNHARGKRPISKWLKRNSIPEINIGSESGAYVHIKWDSKVLPQHASLTYEGGKVFMHPKGPTIVNGREISGKTALKNNDIIKLGKQSNTSMRFVSKAIKKTVVQASPLRMSKSTGIEFYD